MDNLDVSLLSLCLATFLLFFLTIRNVTEILRTVLRRLKASLQSVNESNVPELRTESFLEVAVILVHGRLLLLWAHVICALALAYTYDYGYAAEVIKNELMR